ncbi:MAG: cytochrome-c peroxidase [Bacteroidia bacterium]
MKKTLAILSLILFAAFTGKELYVLQYPSYFPKPAYDLTKNPLTSAKIELGRALFYDPILSANNTISCSSCHSSYNAFAHTDHALSHGISDKIGTRNAPALFNLAWHPSFMWDGAVNHLDVQALAPISHPKEMAEKIENVVSKLQNSKLYPKLFLKAYSDSIITGERVLKSLSQFQLTLVSANSKYDKVKLKKEKFTEQEQNGYKLFQKNCNSCHTEPLFSNYTFANNGLPVDTTLNDQGKWTITKQSADSLKFKVPSLRNLSYTYPYMHDGRFTKLSQVVNHYTQIKHSSVVSKELTSPIVLNSNEKADLIAFLLTLNDPDFTFNPKFSYPKEILLQTAGKAK